MPTTVPARRIDVLMLVGAYPPEISGGGLQCRTLVRALRDRVRFAVLTTTRHRELAGAGSLDGVPVRRVWVDPQRPRSKANAFGALLVRAVSLLPRTTVLHFHGVTQKTALLAALARASRTKLLSKMTSVGADDPISLGARPDARLLAWTLRQAHAHVALSPAMHERFMQAGYASDRVAFIPNAVDGDRFRPASTAERAAHRAALGLGASELVTMFVGFWSRDKAPEVAADAWLAARKVIARPTRLVVLGSTRPDHVEADPVLVTSVRARIAEAGAADAVTLVERTEHIERWLQASDAFVMPSRREGLPNALLEAMATAMPCVVSELPGVTTWLVREGETGCLVPPGDAAAMTRALVALALDPARARRLGDAARVTVLEHCSLPSVAARYLALYRRLGVGAG
jgi:glycosyltransferase involved in cell wall biosynthesis